MATNFSKDPYMKFYRILLGFYMQTDMVKANKCRFEVYCKHFKTTKKQS